jgi:two-component system OmpR family sensor kinase
MEVGASHFVIERALREGAIVLVAACVGALLLLVVASTVLARQAFSPLERIVGRLEHVDEANLTERLKHDGRVDEIGRLVVVVNRMLERLELAFESQKRFTSDVAHEIRSPLTSLRVELEVELRKERTILEYQRDMAACLDEVIRLSRLVEDLMSLAQADAGVLKIRRVPVDLGDLLASLVRRFRKQADTKDILLKLDAAESVTVMGDPDWLSRLVENLLDNAMTHTPQLGEIGVMLAHDGTTARIVVEDNGPGIPRKHLHRVFDRFYRADPSRSRDKGGSGLGLAIAKNIAQLHGGSIRAQNRTSGGSCFTIEIPL